MKIGGFLQCSVDVFLGHDDCFWKIYVKILWNHMKNFQVKHGQCDSIIFPKTFSFESSKELLDLCFPDNMILYFWQVLESIHKFITTELHALQCLFVRGSNKQQRRGRIVSNFTKGHFFVFYDNQVLLGVISQCGPLLTHSRKSFPLFSLAKRRIYLDTQLKGELTDLFWKLPRCSLFPQAE